MEQQSLFNQTPVIHKADWMPPQEQTSLLLSAGEQERRVVNYLKEHSPAGASKIWEAIRKPNEPITSIRRALTNLAEAGTVVKMDETRKGIYGKQEHLWRMSK
jgi:Fe2+ or Zn2+ uptake regulation protein